MQLHLSDTDPLCPLCGTDIGLPAVPELPCKTLGHLGRHFATTCPRTLLR